MQVSQAAALGLLNHLQADVHILILLHWDACMPAIFCVIWLLLLHHLADACLMAAKRHISGLKVPICTLS